MRDVLYIVVTLVFFALSVSLIHGCDRLIGPEETLDSDRQSADAR